MKNLKTKIIKKIIFITLLILVSLINMVYASYDDSRVTVIGTMKMEQNYGEVIITINDNDVKFTQDNEYYYFDITQKMVNYTSIPTSPLKWTVDLKPTYFISEFNSLSTLQINSQEAMGSSYYRKQEFIINGNTFSMYSRKSNGDIESSYATNWFYLRDSNYIHNKSDYINSISFSYEGDGSPRTDLICKAKFGIQKDYIEYLRYFSFIFGRVYAQWTTSGTATTTTRCGIANYTIDLMEYINCEHEYICKERDENEHTIYCSKCMNELTENHNFNIEYDGIENDKCICGLIKQVNITEINTALNSELVLLSTPSELYSHLDNEVEGYDFLIMKINN